MHVSWPYFHTFKTNQSVQTNKVVQMGDFFVIIYRMSWFNYIGLIIIVAIMIPNVIRSAKTKNPKNVGILKLITVGENLGRFGSIFFMIFNIPHTWFSFFLPNGLTIYIVTNAILVGAYLFFYVVFWNTDRLSKALFLSIIPSIIFLFSGIMITSIPLIIFAILFGVTHIYISVYNSGKTRI